MAISINQIKPGLTIILDNQVFAVVEYHHVKPGKGAAFVRTKLRNLKNGAIYERTFKSNERIEEAYIQERKLQYLYRSDKLYNFMDQENFEEVHISEEILGTAAQLLKDNLEITAYSYKGEILNVAFPIFITLKIIKAEPGLRGDTAKAATKSARVETGADIQVPLFIKKGDTIKVDTRSGTYVGRI